MTKFHCFVRWQVCVCWITGGNIMMICTNPEKEGTWSPAMEVLENDIDNYLSLFWGVMFEVAEVPTI